MLQFSLIRFLTTLTICLSISTLLAQRQMEWLDRGFVGLKTSSHSAFLSWRLLASDASDLRFLIYRKVSGKQKERLTDTALCQGTNYTDSSCIADRDIEYLLYSIKGEKEVLEATFVIKGSQEIRNYFEIPLKVPEGYTAADASVGDLDGDGQYELIVHQVGKGHDNAHLGLTDEPVFQAYRLDGKFLWEINLGKNIREGAHYTQFMVYDLNGDGKAEFVCKTADGTVDGIGRTLGNKDADYRDKDPKSTTYGKILHGPEYLTVFDGLTGKAISTVEYIPGRGEPQSWGDQKANRADRYLAAIAYLDGKKPSLIMCRGYYDRTALVAWDFDGKKLTKRWVFDTENADHHYEGQGFHNLAVADVDEDGRDEIIYGSMTVDDDGKGLYSSGLGHGDALHVTDLDPDREGLEIFAIHEHKGSSKGVGVSLRDARNGELLFSASIDEDVTRGVAASIDPNHRGAYMWWLARDSAYNMQGIAVGPRPRFVNFLIWWDGDLSRELLDDTQIAKYNEGVIFKAEGVSSINGTKRTPNLSVDLFGDWREELILRSIDNKSLRIYMSSIPTSFRMTTLMHDPVYRLGIAWQNVAYNQPPHTGFYLGPEMKQVPKPYLNLVRHRD